MVVMCEERVLASRVRVANSFYTRFKGLMGKKSLGDGEGLLLVNCPAVHCFFMRIPIDVVYLSKDMTVLGFQTLSPWSVGRHEKGAAHVLEIAAGTARVSIGNALGIYTDLASAIDVGGRVYAGNG